MVEGKKPDKNSEDPAIARAVGLTTPDKGRKERRPVSRPLFEALFGWAESHGRVVNHRFNPDSPFLIIATGEAHYDPRAQIEVFQQLTAAKEIINTHPDVVKHFLVGKESGQSQLEGLQRAIDSGIVIDCNRAQQDPEYMQMLLTRRPLTDSNGNIISFSTNATVLFGHHTPDVEVISLESDRMEKIRDLDDTYHDVLYKIRDLGLASLSSEQKARMRDLYYNQGINIGALREVVELGMSQAPKELIDELRRWENLHTQIGIGIRSDLMVRQMYTRQLERERDGQFPVGLIVCGAFHVVEEAAAEKVSVDKELQAGGMSYITMIGHTAAERIQLARDQKRYHKDYQAWMTEAERDSNPYRRQDNYEQYLR